MRKITQSACPKLNKRWPLGVSEHLHMSRWFLWRGPNRDQKNWSQKSDHARLGQVIKARFCFSWSHINFARWTVCVLKWGTSQASSTNRLIRFHLTGWFYFKGHDKLHALAWKWGWSSNTKDTWTTSKWKHGLEKHQQTKLFCIHWRIWFGNVDRRTCSWYNKDVYQPLGEKFPDLFGSK